MSQQAAAQTALQTQHIRPDEWGIMTQQADALVKTGFLPQAIKNKEQALAIIMTGRELGIPPMASFSTINVIQGKPTVSPQLMLALINRSGQLEDMRLETGDEGATCTMKRRGRQAYTARFGPQEAQAMGLAAKDNYKKQAPTMFKWRAVADAARTVFPDVVLGLYTPEEMGADVRVTETGEMLLEEAAPADPPPPKQPHFRDAKAAVWSSVQAGAPVTDADERHALVEQILPLAEACGVSRERLDASVEKRLGVAGGLEVCDEEQLRTVLGGLQVRREELELQANILAVVEEQGSAQLLSEHLAARYEGRSVEKLRVEELREVVEFLTSDAPVF
jgi:hypothetical protein